MVNMPIYSRSSQTSVLAFFSTLVMMMTPVGRLSAGTFSVSPVRIYMEARERATAITVANEGDAELVMQAEIFQWTQGEDGSDKLEPTDDMILAPPIVKLAPNSRQVLRLATLKPPPVGTQQTYRMIVREVPEAKPPGDNVQVQVALAFSLPVFITPPGASRKLACTTARAVSGSSAVRVTCSNQGGAYAQPVKMSLGWDGRVLAAGDISAGYILPGIQKHFELKSADGARGVNGPAKLSVTQDDGSQQSFDVQITD